MSWLKLAHLTYEYFRQLAYLYQHGLHLSYISQFV
jgi:hypothetical protein